MFRVSMVLFALLGAILVSACDSASAADMTLTYASPDNPDDSLVIESGPEGRIRAIESSDGQGFIVRDGETYVVFLPERNERAVTRLEDYLAVGAEMRAQMVEDGFFTSGEDNWPYDLEEHGAQTVGQWRGTHFEISPREAPGVSEDIVISTDPALADAQAIAGPAFVMLNRIGAAVLIYPPDFLRLSADIFGRGVPVSVSGRELQSARRDPVPEDHFDLPEPALDRDQLRDRMAR